MQLIEITLQYRCSPTSWLHIFRTHFHRNTPGRLLLVLLNHKIDNLNQILERCLWKGSYLVKLQALLKNELLLNTCFKEHLWWAVYEDILYYTFYIGIHVKVIQSLNYCPLTTWCSAQWRIEVYPWSWNIWRFLGKAHVLLFTCFTCLSWRCERKTLMPLRVGICCWRMAVGWVWMSVR